MAQKKFTILITSNRRGKTRSFSIASSWLQGGVLLAGVFALIISAGVIDYVGLLVQVSENKVLRAENQQLKEQFRLVESKVDTLEKSLERVKQFSKKLRLIANVEDEDRVLKLSVQQPEQVDEAGAHGRGGAVAFPSTRVPASKLGLGQMSGSFLEKAPLDTARGELSIEKQRDYAILAVRIDQAVETTVLREQGVLQLYEALWEKQSLLDAIPNMKPVRGWFTSKFGYRIDPFHGRPMMHNGMFMRRPTGLFPMSGLNRATERLFRSTMVTES